MKQFETKEECLGFNGEHAWHEIKNTIGLSCAVYHSDGYCPSNDATEKCYHCPAIRRYRRIQEARYEWKEE